jgi:hypothetical protein
MLALFMATVLMTAVVAASNRGYLGKIGKSAAAGLVLVALVACLVAADTPAGQPSQPAPTAQAAPGQPDTSNITLEGRNVDVADLASGATFKLRLSYWRTGLAMALDNLWTGVGWGNFGACYPNYKKSGAGAVKMAHNDYLQVLCETGIFGFGLYCAFWLYVAWWGLKRVLREQDRRKRWELVGLYTALLASLAHSVIDFDIYDPSVAFFAFLAAALLVSRALVDTPAPEPESKSRRAVNQLAALPLMLIAALVAGMAFRVYLADLFKGRGDFIGMADEQKINALYYEGQFFFPPPEETKDATKPRAIAVSHLANLVTARSAFESAGGFLVRSQGTKMRRLHPDEPIPRESAVYAVTDFEKAKQAALPYADAWIAELKLADDVFPCEAQSSAEILRWCNLLADSLTNPEDRRRYILEGMNWAQECVRRSPREFIYHVLLGNALWMRARIETDKAEWGRLMDEGLAEFKTGADLFPSSGTVLREYGNGMLNYGRALKQAATAAGSTSPQGEQMVKEAQELIKRAAELDAADMQF